MEQWAIVLGALATLITAVAVVVRKTPQYINTYVQAKFKEHEDELAAKAYERNRTAFREDLTFDMLKDMLEWLKNEHERDRHEAQEDRAVQRKIIEAVNNLAAHLGRNTDVSRILAQNEARAADELGDLKREVAGIKTQWLGRAAND